VRAAVDRSSRSRVPGPTRLRLASAIQSGPGWQAAAARTPSIRKKGKKDDEDKAIRNLLDALEARRTIPLNRLIFALGIEQVGEAPDRRPPRRAAGRGCRARRG
jgi:hypothetical protein